MMANRFIIPLSSCFSVLLLFAIFHLHSPDTYNFDSVYDHLETVYNYVPSQLKPSSRPAEQIEGLRVAVIEQTWYHDEVIGAVLNVLKDVGMEATFYRKQLAPGFAEVIQDIRDSEANPPSSIDSFSRDVDEGKFDVVVLVTGDKKFWAGRNRDIEALNNAKSTHVIAILHETEWMGGHNEDSYGGRLQYSTLAQQDRLTFVCLANHAAERMRKNLAWYIEEKGEREWDNVEVLDFAPVFHVSSAVKAMSIYPPRGKVPGGPSNVAILGRMNPQSRDYHRIISDLARAIEDQPSLWGYEKIQTQRMGNDNLTITSHRYIPSGDPSRPPFKLNLIGQDEGKLEYPPQLIDSENGWDPIIARYSDTSYTDFYNIISSMDLILPAFASDLYTQYRASAAIASGVIAETPILATPEILAGYSYLGGPAYRLQPSEMSEITAIGHMRSGRDPWAALHYDSPPDDPFYGRKQHNTKSWSKYRRDVSKQNVDTWRRVLLEAKQGIEEQQEEQQAMEQALLQSEEQGMREIEEE